MCPLVFDKYNQSRYNCEETTGCEIIFFYNNVNQCPKLNDTHDICIVDCNSTLYVGTMLKMIDYVVIVYVHYK